ncbi:hypothetical protein [Psychromonas marina]|uniref:hypothetical protein n=1 Tax=Psychromonas marina TaxID=88364 RepID=UPI0024E05E5B|nr:hypothetical protein [Psychromonas marina]
MSFKIKIIIFLCGLFVVRSVLAMNSFILNTGETVYAHLSDTHQLNKLACVLDFNRIVDPKIITTGTEIKIPDECPRKEILNGENLTPNVIIHQQDILTEKSSVADIKTESHIGENKFSLSSTLTLKENLELLTAHHNVNLKWKAKCDIAINSSKEYQGDLSSILRAISDDLTESKWYLDFKYIPISQLIIRTKGGHDDC